MNFSAPPRTTPPRRRQLNTPSDANLATGQQVMAGSSENPARRRTGRGATPAFGLVDLVEPTGHQAIVHCARRRRICPR